MAMERHEKILKFAKMDLKEITDEMDDQDIEDNEILLERVGELIKRIEASINKTKDVLLEEDRPLGEIAAWSRTQKEQLKAFRDARKALKGKKLEAEKEEGTRQVQKEIEKHQRINNELAKERIKEQKEIEAATLRKIQLEKEWLEQKIQLQKEVKDMSTVQMASPSPIAQSVKLQRYTITPFYGEYKDWLRFWNQFTVEVDGSSISEISKFHYLLELTKGKPREDILGLPHTIEGYNQAKEILLSTYGKDIKVHKAMIKEIEGLHHITNIQKTASIHDFYNKLSRVVRTLATMKKLDSAQCTVYTLLDKLGPVREIIAQGDDNWEEWKLEQLTQNLRKYVDRNPVKTGEEIKSEVTNKDRFREREKLLFGNGQSNGRRPEGCVYCGSKQHRSMQCTKVLNVANRRDILKNNKLCFNCTGTGHTAGNCKSRSCAKCGQRHHTSLCERQIKTIPEQTTEKSMSASNFESSTIHGTVKARVDGHAVRIMIDTGASSSYVCSDLVTKLSIQPRYKETRCIEQMYGTVTRRVEIYGIKIESTAVDGFSLEVNCINAEKGVLTYLPNPRIKDLKQRFFRLRRLEIGDEEAVEQQLPVHIILGAADYQRIRSTEQPVLGSNPDTDPGAEFTMLGWMLFGRQMTHSQSPEKGFFAKTSQQEFDRLCNLEALGLVDPPQEMGQFHKNFSQGLMQTEDGYYETRLPWKPDHLTLPCNKELAAARLKSTTRRLQNIGRIDEYNEVMKEQIEEGILERVPPKPTGEKVHYIPHQAVIRDDAESTKLRIVYDCSAKQNAQTPSLNDCLDNGPALQPLLFNILLRNRMKRYCITGDIKKAFLQIRISEEDRDAQRILWYDNLKEQNIVEYRFTRVIFGAGPSPYILGATLEKHISSYSEKYPETVKVLRQDTYVDDIQFVGDSAEELFNFKVEASQIMEEGKFTLHKWHSNVKQLEENKEQNSISKILGVTWDKTEDMFQVGFKSCLSAEASVTKRKMLGIINGVFDILGWASPVIITAKILFSEVCLKGITWDENVPKDVQRRWNLWIKRLASCPTVKLPRCVISDYPEKLVLHGFADASKLAICAAVYTLVTYPNGRKEQHLLVAKSRIAPKNMSIPRLELVAAHMLAKLASNVKKALSNTTIDEIHMWSDSMTTLYWLASKGTWSQYVRNRVKSVHELGEWTWHHVPTDQNPSDLGTRGVSPSNLKGLWLKGPEWLADESCWPEAPEIIETEQVAEEALPRKKEKLLMEQDKEAGGCPKMTEWASSLVEKFSYWRLLRVTALVKRFINNCRQNEQLRGPITTEEIESAEKLWLRAAQGNQLLNSPMELRKDDMGIWRCFGRVPGYNPAFIPRNSIIAQKIVEYCHKATLHGGAQAMMSKVRERFWIPQLRQLAKSIRNKCNGCKKQRAKGMSSQQASSLPQFRAEFTEPFTTTGVDFAGPLNYKAAKKVTRKAYVVLFTCSSTRAVHLTLCKDMTTEEFKRTLKWFVARRGKPQLMVSDNAKTFVATKKWLQGLKNDHTVNNYLASESIRWKFNLSRAPWWGGFFERLIGVMKSCLSKVIGNALLTFNELEETLLDIECFMNNRPLTYIGDEFEKPTLTPNILLRGEPAILIEDHVETLDDQDDVTRRSRYMKRSKEQLRRRWISEYLRALEERSKQQAIPAEARLPNGRVVLIKDSMKTKGEWRVGRIEGQVIGKDGIIRGYKIRTGNGYTVERPVQHISDLEIGGEALNVGGKQQRPILNPKANEFVPQRRSTRASKEAAVSRIVGLHLNDEEHEEELY